MTEPSCNTIIAGDCIAVLNDMPEGFVDLIFADPPYNLQLRQALWRPNNTLVDGVEDAWDQVGSFEDYDRFSRAWLAACRRVLKPDGTLWVIGTYHNIHRLGAIIQDLGYWILNDVVWIKTNPMPNFRGVRLTNAHETLIWAARSPDSRHTFNHHAAKVFNGGKQLRSDWSLPICTGPERLMSGGRKLHSTQKPEALLERVLTIATRPGDLVLDPFFGTGTTGAVAKRLHRRWIGIERDPHYVEAALERIAAIVPDPAGHDVHERDERRRKAERIPFAALIREGLLRPGDQLRFGRDPEALAEITPDGQLRMGDRVASIHRLGAALTGGPSCNGWTHWHYQAADGTWRLIDELREQLRR
jgi:modification methylase